MLLTGDSLRGGKCVAGPLISLWSPAHPVTQRGELGRRVLSAPLTDDAQPGFPREAAVSRVDAEDADLTGRTVPVPLEDLDRRRLAGPVRTQQGEGLAALDREADAVDRVQGPVVLMKIVDPYGHVVCHGSSVAASRPLQQPWTGGLFGPGPPPFGGGALTQRGYPQLRPAQSITSPRAGS